MNFKLIFAAAALLATQSFAIAGIGAHYTPNVGTKLRSADRADFKTENVNLEGKLGFSHGNFSYIQGFGFKAWVDILPFVDIEATFNIQFASYNAALWTYDDGEPVKHPLEIEVPINERVIRIKAERGEAIEGTFEVTFTWSDTDISFAEWIEAYGKVPLPPYIHRDAEDSDTERYQTVYARHDGSVAAPTETEYVTLHVGAGTFKPVSSETIGDHFMHEEKIIITEDFIHKLLKNKKKQLIAVGTTVTRTLESLFVIGAKLYLKLENPLLVEQWETYDNPHIHEVTVDQSLTAILDFLKQHDTDMLRASTRLIILPTYKRHIVNGLITNFHQPKSTLLLLISNFLGDDWHRIYQHALESDYRFLSYGDSNLYI